MNIKTDINGDILYKFYRRTTKGSLNRVKYAKLTTDFNKEMVQKIYESNILKLLLGLGDIYISKVKTSFKFTDEGTIDIKKSTAATDWGATNKLWKESPGTRKKIYLIYENNHSNRYQFGIRWRRNTKCVENIRQYKFKPCRAFSRGLSTFIQDNPSIDYYK